MRTGIGPIVKLRNDIQAGKYPELGELLSNFRFYDATVAQDRIYALLGVARDGQEPDLAPAYHKDVQDVYIDTTKYIIAKSRRLDFLCAQSTLYKEVDRLPSWVPDFSYTLHEDCEYVRDHMSSTSKGFDACAGKMLPLSRSSIFSGFSLIVEGILVDRISCRGEVPVPRNLFGLPLFTLVQSYESVSSQAKHMAFDSRDNSDSYPFSKGHTLWAALSLTLVYGISWRNKRCENMQGYLDAPRDEEIPDDFRPYLENDPRKLAWKTEIFDWKTRFWVSRRFVTLKTGYFGLASAAADVGDAVCVLAGAPEPVILRKRDDGSWKFVGSR